MFTFLLGSFSLNCIITNVFLVFPRVGCTCWSRIYRWNSHWQRPRRGEPSSSNAFYDVTGRTPLGSLRSNRSGSIIVRLDSIKPLQTRRRVAVAADNKFDFGVSQKRNEPRRKTVTSPNHRMWTPRHDVSNAGGRVDGIRGSKIRNDILPREGGRRGERGSHAASQE